MFKISEKYFPSSALLFQWNRNNRGIIRTKQTTWLDKSLPRQYPDQLHKQSISSNLFNVYSDHVGQKTLLAPIKRFLPTVFTRILYWLFFCIVRAKSVYSLNFVLIRTKSYSKIMLGSLLVGCLGPFVGEQSLILFCLLLNQTPLNVVHMIWGPIL